VSPFSVLSRHTDSSENMIS